MLKFQRFDPAKCHFPAPRATLLPALNWADLTLGRADTTPAALLDGAGVWHFSRGRYALAAAYRSAGVGPSGALLAPAYHCRTMLDPALALGGAIHFYALNGDLTPQLDSIKAAVAAGQPAIRALVVPHYFGFEQPDALMRKLADFCQQQGIMLIEDCSHAWNIAIERAPTCQAGSGHVVVASPYKFFACADGGMLWGNPTQISLQKQSHPGILSAARAIKTTLAHRAAGVCSMPGPLPAISAEQAAQRGDDLAESSDQPSALYCRDLEGRTSLALSRWVIRRSRLSVAARWRREQYRAWSDAVAGLPGGRALFPDLPLNCAPYMFPLQISAADPQFFQLKQAGVPIWRWDDMAVSDCPIASKYRLHLLHLPCHQSLNSEQIRWMTSTVARVLA
jgi:hypothetical protein